MTMLRRVTRSLVLLVRVDMALVITMATALFVFVALR
jgi:hypothetical protein